MAHWENPMWHKMELQKKAVLHENLSSWIWLVWDHSEAKLIARDTYIQFG